MPKTNMSSQGVYAYRFTRFKAGESNPHDQAKSASMEKNAG